MALSRDDAYAACLTALRETDFDRYLSCLLVPEDRRGALAALYAFSAELARIRDLVREPLPGEVRLQYWRDLVEGQPHGDSDANPLAAGIVHAITEHRLPRAALAAMTEARIFDLYDDPMPDRATFEGYAGETASTLIQLGTLILDPDNARNAAEAAGHAGIAQLVAGCLLLLPIHRRRHQVYLPGDILAAVGLDAKGFLDGRTATGSPPPSPLLPVMVGITSRRPARWRHRLQARRGVPFSRWRSPHRSWTGRNGPGQALWIACCSPRSSAASGGCGARAVACFRQVLRIYDFLTVPLQDRSQVPDLSGGKCRCVLRFSDRRGGCSCR